VRHHKCDLGLAALVKQKLTDTLSMNREEGHYTDTHICDDLLKLGMSDSFAAPSDNIG